jgi:tRNA A37 threonylcarbamoyladenosine biosynthesis protein TsaE
MVAMLGKNGIKRRPSLVVELAGPAGARKTTLSRTLVAYHKGKDR